MCLKKGLPRLTSSKVVFRTFLVTLKQITQSYSSCITDFENGKHLEKHLEASFLYLWLRCYQCFWVLDTYDEWVLSSICLQISRA